jgi:acrylyl-CoA reductase (NADPH)
MNIRVKLWERMADNLKPANLLNDIGHEAALNELPAILKNILKGQIKGRIIVNLKDDKPQIL